MNTTGPIARVRATGDGKNVTGQAGTHLLGRIAGRLGVTAGLSAAIVGTTRRSSAYDRGTVLTQLAMTISAGGRSVSDLKTLRDQPRLFGQVTSDVTAWRVAHEVDDDRRGAIVAVRQAVCRRLIGEADLDEITSDVDATLLHLDSEGTCFTTRLPVGVPSEGSPSSLIASQSEGSRADARVVKSPMIGAAGIPGCPLSRREYPAAGSTDA